jgi:hypothetical protein
MYRPPRTVTARYKRAGMTRAQSLIIRAGLARDPAQAQHVYEDLKREYGADVWRYVDLELRQRQTETFQERLLKLMRRVFGESEPRLKMRRRKREAIVESRYQW